MAQLATPEVLDNLPETGGPNWDRTAADSAAGSTFVTYEDTESGQMLEFRVTNEDAGNGQEHAIVDVK